MTMINSGKNRGISSWNDPDYDGVFSAGDLGLFAEIGEYIQAVHRY